MISIIGIHMGENTSIQGISIYHMSLTINRTKNDPRSNIPNPSPTLLFSSFIFINVNPDIIIRLIVCDRMSG